MPKVFIKRSHAVVMGNRQVSFSTSPQQARSECCVSINPKNPQHMVAASKRFIDISRYAFTVAAYVSMDGGYTWTESALQLNEGWAGLTDPTIAWDDLGHVYLFVGPHGPGTPTDDVDDDGTQEGVFVYKSADGGKSWGRPTQIHRDPDDDKQWAASDTNPQSPFYGHVYVAWGVGAIHFARTTDRGAHWQLFGGSQNGGERVIDTGSLAEINVGPDGTIYIAYMHGRDVKLATSTDGGLNFTTQTVARNVTPIENVFPSHPSAGKWPGNQFPGARFRVLTLPTCCVGPNNNVLVAWADARESYYRYQKDNHGNVTAYLEPVSRIYYNVSLDKGQTWVDKAAGMPLLNESIATYPSGEQKLKDDKNKWDHDPEARKDVDKYSAGFNHDFHPQIVASPDGHVGCAFYEFGPDGIGILMAFSYDEGRTFVEREWVANHPWDPEVGAPLAHGNPNITFIGDYFGLDASSQGFVPMWTDTRTGMQELFVARLQYREVPVIEGDTIGTILGGIASDGGGIIITHNGRVIRVPPRSPIEDLVTAVVIHEFAAEMSDSRVSRQLQTSALNAISQMARQQLGKLKTS